MSENPDSDFMQRAGGDARMLVQALLQAAERYSRELEHRRELARRGSEQEARQAQEWLEAEQAVQRQAARAALESRGAGAPPLRDLADAYARAEAWREHDPQAGAAADRLREELRARWVAEGRQSLDEATTEHNRAATEEAEAQRQGGVAAEARAEETQARNEQDLDRAVDLDGDGLADGRSLVTDEGLRALMARTDAAGADADAAWDSPQRRQQLAEQLRSRGLSEEAVGSRVTADKGVGAPPAAAVAKAPRTGKAKARRARGVPRGQDRALGR
ncbi:MAG: hypothetical protein ACTH0V_11450 [Microbacteriaceae bacterium]